MECVVGNYYQTRFGRRRLIDRPVSEVEDKLQTVSRNRDQFLQPLEGYSVDMRCRQLLLDCISDWWTQILEAVMTKAESKGIEIGEAYASPILVNAMYRPLGTSCAMGTPFEDPCGALDSNDDHGHWSGYAVDVPTKFTRLACYPRLTIEEIFDASVVAGLWRPYAYLTKRDKQLGRTRAQATGGDYVHFRPKLDLI